MRLVFLGAPGSGKGTQATRLSRSLNIPHISTGSILREAIVQGTEVGVRAKGFIDAGKLVPDDVMVEIVRERLAQGDCASGFILDGFPRTIAQAQALDRLGVDIDRVLSLEISDDEIEKRMAGRRVCAGCGATYHVEHQPPAAPNLCDTCGGTLTMRDDDNPETVRQRLRVFHENTEPLKGYYEQAGRLKLVVGRDDIERTAERILQALELPV